MINLLPNDRKKAIRAARTNVLLVRYLSMLSIAILLLGGLVVGSFLTLNAEKQSATEKVEASTTKVAGYQAIRQKVEAFRSELATAKTILDKEVTYSKLIYKIADVVPSGVVLDSLTLDSQTLGSSAKMNASAKTYADAVRLKDAFANNPDLFSDVKFDTLNFSEGTTGASYPVKVNLSVTINKEALL